MIRFAEAMINRYREKVFLRSLEDLSNFTRITFSPDLGRGVESTRDIESGKLLGTYPGRYCTLQELLEKEEFVQKAVKSTFLFTENIAIDPTDIFGFLPDTPSRRIAFINEPPINFRPNTIPISSTRYIWYLVTENIKKGEQIFTHYGHSYKRNYSVCAEIENEKILSSNSIEVLKASKKNYPWLKADIDTLLSEIE